jgi:hypothetical protein
MGLMRAHAGIFQVTEKSGEVSRLVECSFNGDDHPGYHISKG